MILRNLQDLQCQIKCRSKVHAVFNIPFILTKAVYYTSNNLFSFEKMEAVDSLGHIVMVPAAVLYPSSTDQVSETN